MKKIIILITCIILLSVSVLSYSDYKKEIQEKANELKGNSDEETYVNIDMWVEGNITYKYFKEQQSLKNIWKTRIGDCTDKSLLKKQMLEFNNIDSRNVYGFIIYSNKKHDWIEARFENKWITIDDLNYGDLRQVGYGIW